MLHIANPLDIKEKQLFDYYIEIDSLFKLNQLDYDCEYLFEEDLAHNSTLSYTIPIGKSIQSGFITYVKDKDKFGGCVFRTKLMHHLKLEGFSESQVGDEAILSVAETPRLFFLILLAPIIDKLDIWGGKDKK